MTNVLVKLTYFCTLKSFFTTSSISMQVENLFQFAALHSAMLFLTRSGQTSMVQNQAENSLPLNSSINIPHIVSHDLYVISFALENIFCP